MDTSLKLHTDERFLLLLLLDHHSATPREQVKLFKLIERLEFTEAERKQINLRYDKKIGGEVYDTTKSFETEYAFSETEMLLIRKVYNECQLQVRPTKTIRRVIEKFNLLEEDSDETRD